MKARVPGWWPFLHIPSECFSFPCERVCFAITLHSGQSSWLVVLTALPLGWVNFWEAFLGARPTYYRGSTEELSGVLDVLVPRRTAEKLGSLENIDARIKTFCERIDPEKRIVNKTSISFVGWSWSILTSKFDSFRFEPQPSSCASLVPFLCPKSLSGVNRIVGS